MAQIINGQEAADLVEGGGTGLLTITDHSVMVGSGTDPVTPIAVGADNEVLMGASAADPVFTAATGTGTPVLATSPTLVTPILGVAKATSLNATAATLPLLINATTIATDGVLIGNPTAIGSWAGDGVSSAGTANITDVGGAAHSLSLAVGDLVHISNCTTASHKGFYRIVTAGDPTIVLDRVLAATDTDLTVTFYKDVVYFGATDITNGQRIMSYSHQDKPLQIGGDVLVATSVLGSEDVVIGSILGFSDGTDVSIIKHVQETGLGGRLTIGLDETARTMVICDIGDVDTDFGLVASLEPRVVLVSPDASVSGSLRTSNAGYLELVAPNGPRLIFGSTIIAYTSLTQLITPGGISLKIGANVLIDGVKLTAGSGTGITVNSTGNVIRQVYKVTTAFGAYTDSDTTKGIVIATLPAKMKIVGFYADTTTQYTGGATNAATMVVGITAESAAEIIASHNVFAAPILAGNADAEMGTSMTRAAAIQGGYMPSWTGTTAIYATLVIANDILSNLTAGSTTFYIETEQF